MTALEGALAAAAVPPADCAALLPIGNAGDGAFADAATFAAAAPVALDVEAVFDVVAVCNVAAVLTLAGAGVAAEFPAAVAPLPSRKFAAALKSEEVATLKSPAACAVASAAGVCAEDVNASVTGAATVFAGAEISGEIFRETIGVTGGVFCSVCG